MKQKKKYCFFLAPSFAFILAGMNDTKEHVGRKSGDNMAMLASLMPSEAGHALEKRRGKGLQVKTIQKSNSLPLLRCFLTCSNTEELLFRIHFYK